MLHALGAPHALATPPRNKRPVCVGSFVSIAPENEFTQGDADAEGDGVGVGVRVGLTDGDGEGVPQAPPASVDTCTLLR